MPEIHGEIQQIRLEQVFLLSFNRSPQAGTVIAIAYIRRTRVTLLNRANVRVKDCFLENGKEFMRRILIVDNDRDMCGIISEILRDENNEVNIAHDGNTALGRIKKKLMTC